MGSGVGSGSGSGSGSGLGVGVGSGFGVGVGFLSDSSIGFYSIGSSGNFCTVHVSVGAVPGKN